MHVVGRVAHVSDETAQEAWARILAGEANRLGSFSRPYAEAVPGFFDYSIDKWRRSFRVEIL